jgi:hypothetical protein
MWGMNAGSQQVSCRCLTSVSVMKDAVHLISLGGCQLSGGGLLGRCRLPGMSPLIMHKSRCTGMCVAHTPSWQRPAPASEGHRAWTAARTIYTE